MFLIPELRFCPELHVFRDSYTESRAKSLLPSNISKFHNLMRIIANPDKCRMVIKKNDLIFQFLTFGNPKIAPHLEQICEDKAFLALK